MGLRSLISSPRREYLIIALLVLSLSYHYLLEGSEWLVLGAAIVGSLIPLRDTLRAILERKITIEAFNFFALVVSYVTVQYTSAAFIALMLATASWLDWKTKSRASDAVSELLKLKPRNALRERDGVEEVITLDEIRAGDLLIVKNGDRVPADGVVVYGSAFVNEASLTGESKPVEKGMDDLVFSSTLSESGVLKIRATNVGKDSVLERMAELIKEAAKNKSKSERLADRFASIFLPVVLLGGIVLYVVTGNILMTAALFLVACADDIAVSIPLAVAASLGFAAKRGVIIKGGEWLNALAKVDTLVLDKTGTLTYGEFALAAEVLEETVDRETFWRMVALAEKFSEHPVGKALRREALAKCTDIPADPDEVKVVRGAGIWAKGEGHEIVIGNEKILTERGLVLPAKGGEALLACTRNAQTAVAVFIDGTYAGVLGIADVPKAEAEAALAELRNMGIRLIMLTGDNEETARAISTKLGISEYRSGMTPESKLKEIELLAKTCNLAMVGDGINDAPALARADVGIAMGSGGTAVAVEAANVVILTDRLDRIAEMIALSRRTVSVVRGDMAIWFITNVAGVALVLFGIAGPTFAALYNLLTDFLPVMNSLRLFVHRKKRSAGDAV